MSDESKPTRHFDDPSRPITERLAVLRKRLTTGPCGQSSSVMKERSEIQDVLSTAIIEINRLTGYRDFWEGKSDG